jgi:hypothetical protein
MLASVALLVPVPLVAGAALSLAVSGAADAITTTLNVSTTITRSCVVSDAGPPDLAPAYSTTIDADTGRKR